MRQMLVVSALVLGLGGLASADIVSMSAGTGLVNNPATVQPGTAFSLNFTSALSSYEAPYQPIAINLLLASGTSFEQFKIKLDGQSEILSLSPNGANGQQAGYMLYDPANWTPGGNVEHIILPETWKAGLADGVLSGRFWIEGTTVSPSFATLSAQSNFLVPEPVTGAMLLAGGLITLRRRRLTA